MTTTTPLRITTLDRLGWDQEQLDDGQGLENGAIGFTDDQFEREGWPVEAVIAWERVVDEAAAEISPQVRDLLHEALQRRLPWTWEPER
jgi:hypothetical protein